VFLVGIGQWWTEWHWDRFVLDGVALGQVCVGQSGAGTGLFWTEWHWDRFVVDGVALGQICVGQSGAGTGFRWTEWHWDRFVLDGMALGRFAVDRVALGQVCVGQSGAGTGLRWTECHCDRFVLDRVALGQVCVGQSGAGTGVWWTLWHLDRFAVDRVALGQVCGGHNGSWRGLRWTYCVRVHKDRHYHIFMKFQICTFKLLTFLYSHPCTHRAKTSGKQRVARSCCVTFMIGLHWLSIASSRCSKITVMNLQVTQAEANCFPPPPLVRPSVRLRPTQPPVRLVQWLYVLPELKW